MKLARLFFLLCSKKLLFFDFLATVLCQKQPLPLKLNRTSRWTRDECSIVFKRYARRVMFWHLCDWLKKLFMDLFFTLILFNLANSCASAFEAYINSTIKNRMQTFYFMCCFFARCVSFHFPWTEFSWCIFVSLCSASSSIWFVFMMAIFFLRQNRVGWNVRSWFQKDLIFAGFRYSANVYNWIFVFRFHCVDLLSVAILIRAVFTSLFVASQSSQFFFFSHVIRFLLFNIT